MRTLTLIILLISSAVLLAQQTAETKIVPAQLKSGSNGEILATVGSVADWVDPNTFLDLYTPGENEILYGFGGANFSSPSFKFTNNLIDIQNGLLIGEPSAGRMVIGRTQASSLGTDWLAIGLEAGESGVSNSSWIAIGYRAGFNNLSGNDWVAEGRESAYSSTTGREFVAQGNRAGYSNTTGNGWVAQGNRAGFNNLSGNNWVAQGNLSAFSSTTGTEWVSQGFWSGYSNTSGNRWVAQGNRAGYSNITGNEWVAQGSNAGYSNTTGSNWVAQGSNAGYNNVSGSNWVAQGVNAAREATGGNFVASGLGAGRMIEGNNWVAIGANAGARNLSGDLLAANHANSIYLGAESDASDGTSTNEIVIGYDAKGKGSNTSVIGSTSTNETYIYGSLNVEQLPTGNPTKLVGWEPDGDLVEYPLTSIPGDNLGNHTLTQDLITSGWNIRNGAASPMRLNMAASAATFTNNGTPVFTVNASNIQIPAAAAAQTSPNALYVRGIINEYGIDKARPFLTVTEDAITGSSGAATILEQRIVTEADFFRRSRVITANINSATSTADPAYAITGLGISGLKAGQYKYTATIFHSKNSGSSTARSDFEFTIGGTFDAGSVRWHVEGEGGSGLIATRNATGTYIGPAYPGTASYATTLVLTVQFTADGGSITPEIEGELNAGGLNDFINILENSSAVLERL